MLDYCAQTGTSPDSMSKSIAINTFLIGFSLVTFTENLGQSRPFPAMNLGGFPARSGIYIMDTKSCMDSDKVYSIDPETRLKMQLIIKDNKSYFFRRIDSKCAYIQDISVHSLGQGKVSMSFGEAKKYGNCYFSPKRLVGKSGETQVLQLRIKNKKLSMDIDKNPSLKDCNGNSVTWNFKRIHNYSDSKTRIAQINSSTSIN